MKTIKNFDIYQLNDGKLVGVNGGAIFGTTNTNCSTSFTQETKRDKDSNAKCESVTKASLEGSLNFD